MGKAGHEPSCAEVRPINMVEEIASAYLIQAGGNPSVALRRAINDALTDSFEAEQRTQQAERLISRGFVRARVLASESD